MQSRKELRIHVSRSRNKPPVPGKLARWAQGTVQLHEEYVVQIPYSHRRRQYQDPSVLRLWCESSQRLKSWLPLAGKVTLFFRYCIREYEIQVSG